MSGNGEEAQPGPNVVDAAGSEDEHPSGKPREDPPAPDPGPQPAAGEELREQLAGAVNNFSNYYFNGQVLAQAIGTSVGWQAQDGSARRARTGRLTGEEISVLCEHFVEPPLFGAAAEALRRDHVVVLAGSGGLGKMASAVCLLKDVGTGPVEVVSPAIRLAELAKHEFDPGSQYIVEDWQPARVDDTSDFTWRVIRDHVKDSRAHLVITTTAVTATKMARSVTHFSWQTPSADQVLAAHLAGTDAAAVAGEFAEAIPVTYGVGKVADIGRRLAAGEEQSKVLGELSNDPMRHVREWFSADERTDRDIQEVTTLGFAAGLTERLFELMLRRLENTLREAGLIADPEKAGQEKENNADVSGEGAALRPAGLGGSRNRRRRENGLLERIPVSNGGTRQDLVAFGQENAYHQFALKELWRDYDMTFWTAVRDWLGELIADTRVIRDADVQVSVAAGLALLVPVALDEVEESYLVPWAAGELGWSGQQTAVYVLWWMSRMGSLAPIALRIATDWVNSGDPAWQWTAAAALSGELGATYPVEAARRLWHLVGQWKEIPTPAIVALANLFATLTREGEEAYQILALLGERINPPAGRDSGDEGAAVGRPGGPQSWRDERRNRERAMLSILAVLAIRDPSTKQPSITSFLNARPEHRGLVVELWAAVLCNRLYRRRALVALLETVRGFSYVSDDPEAAARALGDALSEELPAVEHEPLKTDFTNLHEHSKRPEGDVSATVRALIEAIERLKPQKEQRNEQ